MSTHCMREVSKTWLSSIDCTQFFNYALPLPRRDVLSCMGLLRKAEQDERQSEETSLSDTASRGCSRREAFSGTWGRTVRKVEKAWLA